MGHVTWPSVFVDRQVGIGDELQANFTAVANVINSNIDGTNVSSSANLSITSVQTPTVITPLVINPSLATDLTLSFGAGSPKKLMITDNNNTSLFEIDNAGAITVPMGMTSFYPIGTVIYFTGTWQDNVTKHGWYKCDGSNGTPDLRNKFIRGGSTSGQTGGYTDLFLAYHTHPITVGNNSVDHTHTLTATVASQTTPSHSHDLMFATATSGSYIGFRISDLSWTGWSYSETVTGSHSHIVSATLANDTTNHTHTFSINNVGVGETGVGDNLPAYYTLIPVMRVS
jgi:hypothetical protein